MAGGRRGRDGGGDGGRGQLPGSGPGSQLCHQVAVEGRRHCVSRALRGDVYSVSFDLSSVTH